MIISVFVLLLQAGGGEAASAPIVLGGPDWVRKATGEDVERVFPANAKRRHVNGAAVMSCSVVADGSLADCVAIAEQPGGEGFGTAALKLAPRFKLKPETKDGRSVAGGVVKIPIRFIGPWQD